MEDGSSPSTSKHYGTELDPFSRFTRFCFYYVLSVLSIVTISWLTGVSGFWQILGWLVTGSISKSLYEKAMTYFPFRVKEKQ